MVFLINILLASDRSELNEKGDFMEEYVANYILWPYYINCNLQNKIILQKWPH